MKRIVSLWLPRWPTDRLRRRQPIPSDRPLVAVMGDPTVCKPHPAQLVWGLALTNISVAIRSGGREHIGTRRSIPAELRARGNVFYAWARLAPDSLVARNANGQAVETYPIRGRRFRRSSPTSRRHLLRFNPGRSCQRRLSPARRAKRSAFAAAWSQPGPAGPFKSGRFGDQQPRCGGETGAIARGCGCLPGREACSSGGTIAMSLTGVSRCDCCSRHRPAGSGSRRRSRDRGRDAPRFVKGAI